MRHCIKAACEAVLQAEGELNALDSKVSGAGTMQCFTAYHCVLDGRRCIKAACEAVLQAEGN